MGKWNRVKWTEAGQVASLLDWEELAPADRATPPEEFFGRLRQAGRQFEAVFFVGQALPRHETVAWAARMVRDLSERRAIGRPEADALKAALLWVQDPTDARRRAAFDAAQAADGGSAERLTAMAAFLSGGSLTPDNCPPVPSPPQASGRLAAGAVLLAAHQTQDWKRALDQALDAGEAMAEHGLSTGPA